MVDEETFNAFRSRPELRDRLRVSLQRICQFYGFDLQRLDNDERVLARIQKLADDEFKARSFVWVSRFSHNHLRITRIIRSLRVLGLEEEAEVFFRAVHGVYQETGQIGNTSLLYWRRAYERALCLAPQNDDDGCGEKNFLHRYVTEKRE